MSSSSDNVVAALIARVGWSAYVDAGPPPAGSVFDWGYAYRVLQQSDADWGADEIRAIEDLQRRGRVSPKVERALARGVGLAVQRCMELLSAYLLRCYHPPELLRPPESPDQHFQIADLDALRWATRLAATGWSVVANISERGRTEPIDLAHLRGCAELLVRALRDPPARMYPAAAGEGGWEGEGGREGDKGKWEGSGDGSRGEEEGESVTVGPDLKYVGSQRPWRNDFGGWVMRDAVPWLEQTLAEGPQRMAYAIKGLRLWGGVYVRYLQDSLQGASGFLAEMGPSNAADSLLARAETLERAANELDNPILASNVAREAQSVRANVAKAGQRAPPVYKRLADAIDMWTDLIIGVDPPDLGAIFALAGETITGTSAYALEIADGALSGYARLLMRQAADSFGGGGAPREGKEGALREEEKGGDISPEKEGAFSSPGRPSGPRPLGVGYRELLRNRIKKLDFELARVEATINKLIAEMGLAKDHIALVQMRSRMAAQLETPTAKELVAPLAARLAELAGRGVVLRDALEEQFAQYSKYHAQRRKLTETLESIGTRARRWHGRFWVVLWLVVAIGGFLLVAKFFNESLFDYIPFYRDISNWFAGRPVALERDQVVVEGVPEECFAPGSSCVVRVTPSESPGFAQGRLLSDTDIIDEAEARKILYEDELSGGLIPPENVMGYALTQYVLFGWAITKAVGQVVVGGLNATILPGISGAVDYAADVLGRVSAPETIETVSRAAGTRAIPLMTRMNPLEWLPGGQTFHATWWNQIVDRVMGSDLARQVVATVAAHWTTVACAGMAANSVMSWGAMRLASRLTGAEEDDFDDWDAVVSSRNINLLWFVVALGSSVAQETAYHIETTTAAMAWVIGGIGLIVPGVRGLALARGALAQIRGRASDSADNNNNASALTDPITARLIRLAERLEKDRQKKKIKKRQKKKKRPLALPLLEGVAEEEEEEELGKGKEEEELGEEEEEEEDYITTPEAVRAFADYSRYKTTDPAKAAEYWALYSQEMSKANPTWMG